MAAVSSSFHFCASARRPPINSPSLKLAQLASSFTQPLLRELQRGPARIDMAGVIKKTCGRLLDAFVDFAFHFEDQPWLPSQRGRRQEEEEGRAQAKKRRKISLATKLLLGYRLDFSQTTSCCWISARLLTEALEKIIKEEKESRRKMKGSISAVHSNHSKNTLDLSLIYWPCHSQKIINRPLIYHKRGRRQEEEEGRVQAKKRRKSSLATKLLLSHRPDFSRTISCRRIFARLLIKALEKRSKEVKESMRKRNQEGKGREISFHQTPRPPTNVGLSPSLQVTPDFCSATK
ncbi:hypothetical protein M5K25_025001 [Dendrobium thyrsiflorum]|uniref:Uncharacterized protein n=1 Tax=Dendrobium thyrsiflorum TaxID=117978 RepID=A0ABD0U385_DENTH